MADTLTTYRAKVQTEIGDTSSRAQSVIDYAIKDIYQEILQKTYKFIAGSTSEQITTTVSTAGYTPTNTYQDYLSVHHLNNGNWDLLKQISREDYLEHYINESDGIPVRWYKDGQDVHINPAPSTAGTILLTGIKVPAELTTQDSEIPIRYSQTVVLGAVARVLGYEKDPLSAHYKGLYEMSFNDMLQDLSTQTAPLRVPFMKKRFVNYLR